MKIAFKLEKWEPSCPLAILFSKMECNTEAFLEGSTKTQSISDAVLYCQYIVSVLIWQKRKIVGTRLGMKLIASQLNVCKEESLKEEDSRELRSIRLTFLKVRNSSSNSPWSIAWFPSAFLKSVHYHAMCWFWFRFKAGISVSATTLSNSTNNGWGFPTGKKIAMFTKPVNN